MAYVEFSSAIQFFVTFTTVLGELPLLVSSRNDVTLYRVPNQFGVSEIQTMALSVNNAFVYEIQEISVLNSSESYSLPFYDSPRTKNITCNLSNSNTSLSVTKIKTELERVSDAIVEVNVLTESSLVGDRCIYRITFLEPVGPLNRLQANNANVSEVVRGK